MKIKQLIFLVVSILLSLGAMTIRIFQFEYAIDPTTGYYINENSLVNFLYIVAGIFALVVVVAILFLPKKDIRITMPMKTSTIFAYRISSMIVFIGLVFSVMVTFMENGMDALLKITALDIVNVVFGIFLFIYVVSIVFDIDYKNKNIKLVFSLAPVCWYLSCLMKVFFKYTGIANISEHIFEILMLCSLVLFFITIAKASFVKRGNKITFIFGIIAVFVSAIYVVPQTINILTNNIEDAGVISALGTQLFNFGILLFIVSILIPRKSESESQLPINEIDDMQIKESIEIQAD